MCKYCEENFTLAIDDIDDDTTDYTVTLIGQCDKHLTFLEKQITFHHSDNGVQLNPSVAWFVNEHKMNGEVEGIETNSCPWCYSMLQ